MNHYNLKNQRGVIWYCFLFGNFTKCTLIIACILFIIWPNNAQVFQWEDTLPVDTTVISGQLDNGIRYFIKNHDEPKDRAVLRLIIKTGSLQENEDQLGVAHFVEHMAFNGTEHFDKNEIIHFIERSGSRFGADLNAYTSFDETVYKLLVQTDTISTIDTALLIMEDWAKAVSFSQEEIEAERGIVIAEWRNRLSSRQRIQQQVQANLFGNSRYGSRFPIGSPELIDTVSRKRLLDYYQKWYQPHRMAIIAIGSFDEQWMENEIKTRFSKLINSDNTPTEIYELEQSPKRDFKLITDPEAPFTQWDIYYQLERKPQEITTIANLRNELIYSLYSAMLNKRFVEIKEKANPSFTFANAGFAELVGGYRTYQMGAFTEIDKLIPSIETIVTESRRAALHGFTESEFKRQKTAYLEGLEQMLKERDKIPSAYLANRIQREIEYGGLPRDLGQTPAIVKQCLDSINLQDIHQIGAYWQNSTIQNIILTTGNENISSMPDSLRFYGLLDSLLKSSPAAFEDVVQEGPLVTPQTPVGTHQFIQKDSVLNISEYCLSNGIKIHLKTTDFQNDQILFRAFSPGGRSLYPDEDYYSSKHLLSILSQSGLGDFNKTTLSKALTGKQVRLSPYLSEYQEGLSGQSNQADLEILFQLIHLYFTEARFDSIALENYQADQENIFDNIDVDPRSAFGRMIVDVKYQNHIRRPSTKASEFSKIDLGKATQIFNERFEDANDFTFVFVGNIDQDSLLFLAGKYLAGLPVKGSEEHWQDRGLRKAPYPIDTLVIAGQTPKSDVFLEWHTSFPYDDPKQRYVFYSLEQLLSTKLREKLREEMSGVYGVRINMNASSIPTESCRTQIRFNASPDKIDSLNQAITQVIELIAEGEVTLSDIEKIQATQLKSSEEAKRKNGFWLSQISRRLQSNYSYESLYPGKYEATVASLAGEELSLAARKYILEAIHHKFILKPEEIIENED